MKKVLAILLILTSVYNAFCQTDSIDVFIQERMKERKIPGLQLAIVRNGKVVKTGNYGFSNVQDSIPVSDKNFLQSIQSQKHLWELQSFN
jgi:CubicO group peptidase (beta-lactamase class C family)